MQGSQCGSETTQYVLQRGGKIYWLSKNLRAENSQLSMYEKFQQALEEMIRHQVNEGIPIAVTIDAGSLDNSVSPLANNVNGVGGFKLDEILAIARAAGANSHVALLHLTEFSPSADDSRLNMIMLELLYHFSLGYSTRPPSSRNSSSSMITPLGFRPREEIQLPTFNESLVLSGFRSSSTVAASSIEALKAKTLDYNNNDLVPSIYLRQHMPHLDLSEPNLAAAMSQHYPGNFSGIQSTPNSARRNYSGPPTPVAAYVPDANAAILRSVAQQSLSQTYPTSQHQQSLGTGGSTALARYQQQQQQQVSRHPYTVDATDSGINAAQYKNIPLQQQLALQQARNFLASNTPLSSTSLATSPDIRSLRSNATRSSSNSATLSASLYAANISRSSSSTSSSPHLNSRQQPGYFSNSGDSSSAFHQGDLTYSLDSNPHPYDEALDLNIDSLSHPYVQSSYNLMPGEGFDAQNKGSTGSNKFNF